VFTLRNERVGHRRATIRGHSSAEEHLRLKNPSGPKDKCDASNECERADENVRMFGTKPVQSG